MDPNNPNQTPGIKIVSPGPPAPRRRRIARWLTLAALVFILGTGSMLWLVRDNTQVVEAATPAIVEITPNGFVPQTIRVKQGQSVMWVNKDTGPHQITANPFAGTETPTVLASQEPLARGDSFTASIERPGTFTYQDKLDPVKLTGAVIVEQ